MARSELIQSFMLTQSLEKNIGIGQDKELKFIEEEKYPRNRAFDYETIPCCVR